MAYGIGGGENQCRRIGGVKRQLSEISGGVAAIGQLSAAAVINEKRSASLQSWRLASAQRKYLEDEETELAKATNRRAVSARTKKLAAKKDSGAAESSAAGQHRLRRVKRRQSAWLMRRLAGGLAG